MDSLHVLRSTLQDAESSRRGFLLTGDARFLDRCEAAASAVGGQAETLRSRLDEPAPAHLEPLGRAVDAELAVLVGSVGLARQRGIDAARAAAVADPGLGPTEELRAHFRELEADEVERRVGRLAKAADHRSVAGATAIVAGVANLALLGAVVVLLHRSLRERSASSARLREQKELFRTTLESIGDAVIATDVDGRVTFLNGMAQRLTGVPAEEAVGQPLSRVYRVESEGSREPMENPVDRALRTGGAASGAADALLIGRDGEERPVDERAAPIRDEGARLLGAVLVFRDVSAARRAARQLEEEHQRKDEFLAVMAHELRNPLAPLRNALQVLRLSGHDPHSVRQLSELMERQLEQMVRLIDDLMEVSLITRNQLPLRKENLSIETIVQAALEMSQPVLEQRGQDVTVALPEPPLRVAVDKTRMTQALCNLLRNAAKYSSPGGHVRVSVEPAGRDVLLRVQDTGIGIPPEMLERIFEMFTRVDRSLDRSQGGLGIGLALVRRIVERHGGTIVAHSTGPGHGSEFVIRLPAIAAPERQSPQAQNGHPSPARRIVVVDDNRDSADSLAMMLRMSGHEVAVAYDGVEALEVAARFRPELMLVDLGMPRLDGYGVARRMREGPAGQEIRLVALTGWGQEHDRRRSEAAGFDRHLVKPIEPQELARVLTSLWPASREAPAHG